MKNNSFVKQATILAAAGLFSRFLGFLYKISLTDMLGDEGNGIFGAGYDIYTFLFILSSAGLPAAIAKMVSERLSRNEYANAHKVFTISLKFALISGLIASVVMWFGARYIVNIIASPRSYFAILALAPTIFIVAIMSVYRGYFQGMGNTVPTAISQVIEQIFNAIFSVLLAYFFVKTSIELGAAGANAGTGIGAIFGFITVYLVYILAKPRILKRKRRSRETESGKKILKELLFTAIPIVAGAAVFSITNIIDTNMVMGLLTQSGHYTDEDAYKLLGQLKGKYVTLVTLPVSISTSFATACIPSIASSNALNQTKDVKHKIDLALRLTMIVSIPAAVGMGVLGTQIIEFLFPQHKEGGELIIIGAASIVFLALCQILTGILQGTNYVKVPLIAAFCGAVCKVIINWLLIPIPGINILGAVISTIGCYIVAVCINFGVLSYKTKYIPDFIGTFVKPFIASAVMGIACYAVYYGVYLIYPNNALAVVIAICTGVFIYFVFMLLIKGFKDEDLALFPFGKRLIAYFSEE